MQSLRVFQYFLIWVGISLVSGCATYGTGIDKAIRATENGQYTEAETILNASLSPNGADRLLYFMELAVVKHLQKQYVESNALLDQAENIAEDLETQSISNALKALLTNPRQGDYAGSDFEKIFINYYKALNYLAISAAAETNGEYQDALENARIESRRLSIRLNAINDEQGTYQEQKSRDEMLFSKVLDVFEVLQGNAIDFDKLVYRDDALAHYLTGISYEINREYDNARISYQKAATSYEDGFSEQFSLGSGMIRQAWFDTIRMMRLAGGYENEWKRLAKEKLTSGQRKDLDKFDGKAQLVVLEHVGLVPQRREMNLLLSADARNRTLRMRPVGNVSRGALAWFYMVYADKSLLDLVANYYNADLSGFLLSGFTKTFYLGNAWGQAEKLGVISAIGSGLRVTVPYYAPEMKQSGASAVTVEGHRYPMKAASNLAIMGMNEQLLNANADIQLAFSRAILKSMTAQKAGEIAGGALGGLISDIGKIAGQLTEAADTRNWLLLPHEIRVSRIPLQEGEYDVALRSSTYKGQPPQVRHQKVRLLKNEVQLLEFRSLSGNAQVTTDIPTELKTVSGN